MWDIFTWFLPEGEDISHILSFQINNPYIFPSIFSCFNLFTIIDVLNKSLTVQISRLNLHERLLRDTNTYIYVQGGSTPINLG